MWVANKGVQSKLEELPIPFSDVRNIVEELYLEDELTRSRCRAWLVLSSHKYLQADIIFPGCIVDCRVMIRPLSSEFLSFLPHCQTITCVKKNNKTKQDRTENNHSVFLLLILIFSMQVWEEVVKTGNWLTLFYFEGFVHRHICTKTTIILFLTAYATQISKHEQEQTKVLAGYLSKLKFTEANGIHLPHETLPEGFLFNYKRRSHRAMYVPRDGFTLIVSEESTWCRDDRGEQNRETVRTDLIKEYSLLFMGT